MQPSLCNSISARFSAAAASYDRAAEVQRRVSHEVIRLLDAVAIVGPILEIGCGTGILTARLRERYPDSVLHAVDLSNSMIEQAQARLADGHEIHWHVGDARSWGTPASFQLVTASSVLHWLAPIDRSLQHLASLVCPGGYVALGVMVHGTLAELHEVRRIVAPQKTAAHHLPTAEAVRASLAATSLCLLESRTLTLPTWYCSSEAFLRAIHAQGVTTGWYDANQMLNRSELMQLIDLYNQRYRIETKGVCATYEVLLILARQGTPG
jgi:malonyl-CoA O-methyltransferase